MTAQKACKLCFKESKDFQVIKESMQEILKDVLQLKIDCSITEDYVICESCVDCVYTFSEFKSACLYSEDCLVPFVRTTVGMEVDIVKTAYLKKNPSATAISNSDDAICRLCLKINPCVDLNVLNENFAEDIIARCIPEINTKSTRDPKICLSCQTSLINYYQFVTKCLVKQENIVERDNRDACLAIKSEELDIKMEEEECDRNTNYSISLMHSNVMLDEDNEIKSFVDKSFKQEAYDMSIKSDTNQNGQYPKDHELIEDVAKTHYHCEHCPYVTNQKGDLSKHVLNHRIRTHDCSFCSYNTKRKGDLTTHMLIHKDASEVMTYQCALCPYNTKWKGNLSKHILIHKDVSEVTTYDCSFCSYKAKQKNHLNAHMLIHKDVSEVTTYQCTLCPYKAKRKSYLTGHMLIHKNASEVTTYSCSFCSFRTKLKGNLTRHMLIHKDASEITTYDCSFCSYKAKQKGHLITHMLIHKDASEVTTYDCSFCSYKTKRKHYLTTHMLIHKDASEITIYPCAHCSFKTKWKKYLVKHMRIHTDAS